jgi:hypothetical protein
MKFKCVHTGQVYEYLVEQDIREMLKHAEYSAVEEEAVQEVVQKPVKQAKKKETALETLL